MKIIVTGGRDYSDSNFVCNVLKRLDPEIICVGDCPTGVDYYVEYYCSLNNIEYFRYKADWKNLGKKAGPIRNYEMVKANLDADFLLAFPGGKGTENCIKWAIEYDIPVLRVINES